MATEQKRIPDDVAAKLREHAFATFSASKGVTGEFRNYVNSDVARTHSALLYDYIVGSEYDDHYREIVQQVRNELKGPP